MEKLIAQAKVYYIIAYGRDSSVYTEKKWILGKIYLTDRRILFKKIDRSFQIPYSLIEDFEEKDKYSRISPPIGWSRGNILEIKHYEDSTKKHILTSLISAEFDVTIKLRAILTHYVRNMSMKITNDHLRILLALSLGIKNNLILSFLTGLKAENVEKLVEDLRFFGFINSDGNLTTGGRKKITEIKKNM